MWLWSVRVLSQSPEAIGLRIALWLRSCTQGIYHMQCFGEGMDLDRPQFFLLLPSATYGPTD